MTKKIIFGEIDGIIEGHRFDGRREMMENSFHRNWARYGGVLSSGHAGHLLAIILNPNCSKPLHLLF